MSKNLLINGETVAASQEGALVIELFLNDKYLFRRNVLNGKVEFLTLPESEGASWRPLTQEALNSIILKAEREHIMEKGSPSAKIKMYVQSEEVPVFNPVTELFDSLPQWDGKNHVAAVFSRIPARQSALARIRCHEGCPSAANGPPSNGSRWPGSCAARC